MQNVKREVKLEFVPFLSKMVESEIVDGKVVVYIKTPQLPIDNNVVDMLHYNKESEKENDNKK